MTLKEYELSEYNYDSYVVEVSKVYGTLRCCELNGLFMAIISHGTW